MPVRRAAVIGAGSWGTSMAIALARAGDGVALREGVGRPEFAADGAGGPDGAPQPTTLISNRHPTTGHSARISPRWPHWPIEH